MEAQLKTFTAQVQVSSFVKYMAGRNPMDGFRCGRTIGKLIADVQQQLEGEDIARSDWSALFPDLNPIEGCLLWRDALRYDYMLWRTLNNQTDVG
ncbi:hypothetical protein TNCV_2109181 [Trichonephila clavipes]|nr:hypothetical protein TNCV_2109181 [Trichonephila clavipes]